MTVRNGLGMPALVAFKQWLLAGLCLLGGACTTHQELAAQLQRATRQQHLPLVVACWESEFETAGFRGQYQAVVDFTVSSGSGRIGDVVVQQVLAVDAAAEDDTAATAERLAECLANALVRSSLARGGMKPGGDVHVKGFRFAFIDASSEARQAAADHAPTILIGPRASRCNGLYTHEPPREAAELVAELADAQGAARRIDPGEQDEWARALQKTYDVALELRARLELEARRDDLSAASRLRTRQELRRVQAIAQRTGALIGCEVP